MLKASPSWASYKWLPDGKSKVNSSPITPVCINNANPMGRLGLDRLMAHSAINESFPAI